MVYTKQSKLRVYSSCNLLITKQKILVMFRLYSKGIVKPTIYKRAQKWLENDVKN